MKQEILTKAELNTAYFQTFNSKAQGKVVSTLLANPELALLIFKLILRLADWAIKSWIDKKTGKMKTPWWVKFAALLGSGTAKELSGIASDSVEVASKLR